MPGMTSGLGAGGGLLNRAEPRGCAGRAGNRPRGVVEARTRPRLV